MAATPCDLRITYLDLAIEYLEVSFFSTYRKRFLKDFLFKKKQRARSISRVK